MKKLLLAALTSSSVNAHASTGIDEALEILSRHSSVSLPALSTKDRRALEGGEGVSLVSGERVAGMIVVPASLSDAWAIVHDQAVIGDPAVQEVRLSAKADGEELWYGRMGLPTPLADREWVVRSTIRRELATVTKGKAWERAWTEVPDGIGLAGPAIEAGHLPGVRRADLGTAVYTPVNRGGWVLVALDPGRTLVTYHARTDLGGSVPTWLVRDVAKGQVKGLLDRVRRGVGRPHPAVVPGG